MSFLWPVVNALWRMWCREYVNVMDEYKMRFMLVSHLLQIIVVVELLLFFHLFQVQVWFCLMSVPQKGAQSENKVIMEVVSLFLS